MISYSTDTLFFAPKKENINVNIELDPNKVESSSILYFFQDNISSTTNSNDVISILGTSTKSDSSLGAYSIRYSTSKYTLDEIKSDYIFAYFNKAGEKGKIRSIAWQYEKSDKAVYDELLNYLIEILGEPTSQSTETETLTADWPGYHLECNSNRIHFAREFY